MITPRDSHGEKAYNVRNDGRAECYGSLANRFAAWCSGASTTATPPRDAATLAAAADTTADFVACTDKHVTYKSTKANDGNTGTPGVDWCPSQRVGAGKDQSGGESLYPGLAGEFDSACIRFGQQAEGAGLDGQPAILVSPNKWNGLWLNFYCGSGINKGRKSLAEHKYLTFRLRAASADDLGASTTLTLSTWHTQSASKDMLGYIEGGKLSTEWKRVTVPLEVFRGATKRTAKGFEFLDGQPWQLCDVQSFGLGPDAQGRQLWIDDIRIHGKEPVDFRLHAIETADSTTVVVVLDAEQRHGPPDDSTGAWAIAGVKPLQVSRWSHPVE